MHIYQLSQLYIAIFIGGSGVILLTSSMLAMLKKKQLKTYEDTKWVVVSLYYTAFGAWSASRAFDLPHHESRRTSVIDFVLLFALAIVLVGLPLMKRSQKNTVAIKLD